MNHFNSPVFGEYYAGMKPCVLDIEATGLDPSRCKVILMGLLTETDSGVRVTQFLAENHYEEHLVLQATADFLRDEKISYLITFNGLRYDIPFINTRVDANFLDSHIRLYDFDLYRFLRKCSNLPKTMKSLSQAACEMHFGIAGNRQDTITGRESVALFDEYSMTGNSTVEKIILTHNREDVLQLYQLIKLASANEYRDILDDDFHTAIAKYGFPAGNGRLSARPSLIASKKILRIVGDQLQDPVSAAYFADIDNPVTATFNKASSTYEILIPVEEHDNTFYVDTKSIDLDIKDRECINGFLVLGSRTINILAKEIIEKSVSILPDC